MAGYRNVLSCVTQMRAHTCTQMEIARSKDPLCVSEKALLFSKGEGRKHLINVCQHKDFAIELLSTRRVAARASPSHSADRKSQ